MTAEDQKFWDQVFFITLRESLIDKSRSNSGSLNYGTGIDTAVSNAASAARAALKLRNFPR